MAEENLKTAHQCHECEFWKKPGGADSGRVGECHRRAPVPSFSPVMDEPKAVLRSGRLPCKNHWCGEFEKKPVATEEVMNPKIS
jgi:hypothetical protein